MVEPFFQAFGDLMSPLPLFLLFLGVILGIIGGSLPGITGAMMIALCLPITFEMDPVNALILLVGIYVGAISGGLISATLMRMPGTPAAVMTTLDGYPMARNGRPGRALGLGISASFVGGLISCIFLIFYVMCLEKKIYSKLKMNCLQLILIFMVRRELLTYL